MPKIIKDARKSILQAAKTQLLESGYNHFSMRAIASECSIAVGTLYNYFPSKLTMIASVMMEDWEQSLMNMKEGCADVDNIFDGFSVIYNNICSFANIYRDCWAQYKIGNPDFADDTDRHSVLVGQLKALVEELISRFGYQDCLSLSSLLAELILAAAIGSRISADEVRLLAYKLFPQEAK